jgi:hypothetical protein
MSGYMPDFAKLKGISFEPQQITPNSAQGAGNSITADTRVVKLLANANDVNDFSVLPSLATVQDGTVITILAGAANSELRTPASSNEKINNVDSDGTQEALLTAANVYTVTKLSNTAGWMLEGRTAIGAYQTAIIPD